MKYLFIVVVLFIGFNPIANAQSNNLHISYSFTAISDKPSEVAALEGMINDCSKEYYTDGKYEVLKFKQGKDIDFAFKSKVGEDEVKLFLIESDKKYMAMFPLELYEGFKKRMKKDELVWTEKPNKKHLNHQNKVTTLELQGRELEFLEAESLSTSLPFSTYLEIKGSSNIALVTEILMPQRQGVVSKAKVRIEASSVNDTFDPALMEVDEEGFVLKTIDELQKELGMSYMMIFIFN